MSRRGVIILNPTAGRGKSGRLRPRLEQMLKEAGADTGAASSIVWTIRETSHPGQALEIATDCASASVDVVAAAGGDGTLNEVLNGIVGTSAHLALLPLGTGNDFARSVGTYGRLPLAIETLFNGTPIAIDVGNVAGRYFLNVAGCGFDAIVAEQTNRGLKRLNGTVAYLAAIIRTLARFRAAEFHVTADGERRDLRAMLCSVANARTYGGGMRIAPGALLNDGHFDLCLLSEAGRYEFLKALPQVFRGTHITHPKVEMLKARHVRIDTSPPLPVLVDGEVIGQTPAEFTIHPAAVTFLFPRRASTQTLIVD